MVSTVTGGNLDRDMAASEENGEKGKQEEEGAGVREDWDEERKEPKRSFLALSMASLRMVVEAVAVERFSNSSSTRRERPLPCDEKQKKFQKPSLCPFPSRKQAKAVTAGTCFSFEHRANKGLGISWADKIGSTRVQSSYKMGGFRFN